MFFCHVSTIEVHFKEWYPYDFECERMLRYKIIYTVYFSLHPSQFILFPTEFARSVKNKPVIIIKHESEQVLYAQLFLIYVR